LKFGHQIADLIIAISKDAENIRALARIADALADVPFSRG
jgi:hypothetical protein